MRIVKSLKANPVLFIFILFIAWRAVLFLSVYLSGWLFELQNNFLGGGKGLYLTDPYLWSWLNFDGEHYLSIARYGYKPLQYFYFPIYPGIVGLISKVVGEEIRVYAYTGLIISHISFITSLVGLYKIIKLDFQKINPILVIALIAIFPTSFYFGSFYSESLFLALVVWSFYFMRRRRWFWGAVLASFATATRPVGIIMLPVYLIELVAGREKNKVNYLSLLLIPIGIFIYMFFLKDLTGDWFAYNANATIYGEYKSQTAILLPRIFYRYIFKIIPNLTWSYFPQVFSILMEFIVAIGLFLLSFYGVIKLRLSYYTYMLGAFIIPTMYNGFTSLPRYAVVCFPAFILLSVIISKLPRPIQICIFALSVALLLIATSMFVKGYWVA